MMPAMNELLVAFNCSNGALKLFRAGEHEPEFAG
jgi:hypothetical protein